MKRFLFGFLAVLFLILNTIPYLHILADDMPTSSQYEMLGAYALSTLITSGEATELDFSDYTENDTSFLIDLGEAIFTGDWSGLAEDGLEWLGETADSIYDSYKEYVSQWKYDHLGIMYSNWFPDEEIRVGPDDSYSLAKPLRELLTPRGDDSGPTPNPDPNYLQILDVINGNGMQIIRHYDPNLWIGGSSANSYVMYNLVDVSNASVSWNNSQVQTSDILTINIFSANDTYNFTVSSIPVQHCNQSYYYSWASISYTTIVYNSSDIGVVTAQRNDVRTRTRSGSLSQLLYFISNNFKNVNIYVDDVPWSIVGSNEPTYPIVIPDQLTIYNNQPLEYSFPADTYIELPDLTNIIRNAINSSGVVMWSDIADVFVDVNGQTAIAFTKIVRNDYDNLYMEQYPYPAMLVGMTDQTKFNEHLLDNSHAYLSPMGTIVQETVNILPSELVGVLAIGAILTIFAVIINRLLE